MKWIIRYGCFLWVVLGLSVRAVEKPNFLVIAIDDLNHYVSFLQDTDGNFIQKLYPDEGKRAEVAKLLTPNLQKLADRSMIFSQTYCSQALCGPSRTAMMTGVPPHVSGYEEHSKHFRHHDSLKNVVTLPQYLKNNGYFTAGVGKIFHKASVAYEGGIQNDWPDRLYSWSHWVDRPIGVHTDGSNKTKFSPYSPDDRYMKFGLTTHAIEDTHDYQNAKFIAEVFEKGSGQIKDKLGQLHTMTLPEGQPFYLVCGLFAPHMPWSVHQSFYDRFPVDELGIDEALRNWTEEDIKDLSEYAIKKFVGGDVPMLDDMAAKVHGEGKGQLEAWKAAVQAYLATIAYADECVGLLLEAIEKSPHSENTVIVVHSDHGWHLGDKYRYRKHCLWGAATRSVFMISDPKYPLTQVGNECVQLISLQDYYPTVVSRAGLGRPSHVHGRDFSPLMEDPLEASWENVVLTTWSEENDSVRTDRYLLIRYEDGSRELYNVVKDPWEYENLADVSSYKPVLKMMEDLLDERLNMPASDY